MVRLNQPLLLSSLVMVFTLTVVLGVARVADAATLENDNTHPCFLLHAQDGQWKVSPDSRSIYVVENGVVYRLDLQQPIPLLQSPWAILNTGDSSEAVCRPEDLHLVVSDRLGGESFPIITKITALTSQEVAALPKRLRPQ